jgi:hypothetical protein
LGVKNRVENEAGERKGVANDSFPDSQRPAVPTVSGFVRVLKDRKVVTTLIGKLQTGCKPPPSNPHFQRVLRGVVVMKISIFSRWIFVQFSSKI